MYYRRPILGYAETEKFHKTAQVKRRRPYDTQLSELSCVSTASKPSSSSTEQKQNGIKQETNDDVEDDADGGTAGASKSTINIKQELKSSDDETDDNTEKQETEKQIPSSSETPIAIKKESMLIDEAPNDKQQQPAEKSPIKLENSATQKPNRRKYGARKLLTRQKLNVILQKLIDRIPDSMVLMAATGAHSLVTHLTSANSRTTDLMHHHHQQQQQQHVSPRKRILRELEKVSLDDLSTMKRSRAKGTNSICHPVVAAQSSSSSVQTSSAASLSHYSIAAANQQPQLSFPYLSGPGKIVNGSNSDQVTTIAQPISKPISSYSITSLLGHNNNNNNPVKSESSSTVSSSQHTLDRDHYIRSMVTSPPKSPTASQPIKPSSAFTSKKKSSPSYGNSNRSCLSPSISTTTPNSMNHFNRNSSLHSPINYGRTRSPDLSPSPEQIYSRFRQTHGISNSAVSSPSSTGFHPYLSSGQSSRGSPSGALSPLSDRYRSNLLPPPTSPSHTTYSPAAAARNSGSPLSYARYSPSLYSQISPQHCSSKTNYPTPSTAFNLNSIMNSSGGGGSKHTRDKSPQSSAAAAAAATSTTRSETYLGTRTVPKKTAAFRQQYEANVSSPSMIMPSSSDSKASMDAYFKNSMTPHNNEQAHNKRNTDSIGSTSSATTSLNLSRSKSPADHQHHSHQHHSIKYEKDYRIMNSNSTILPQLSSTAAAATAAAAAAGLDIDSANSNVIRPSLVPASSLQHSQNMYFMYGPPSHSSPVGVATSSPFLSPTYYHSMTLAAAGAYRPFWMHFPSAAAAVAAAASVPQSRMPHTQLMPYGSGLGPPMLPPSSSTSSSSTSTPWGLMPPHHHNHHHSHHSLLADDPVSLVRIKDEPSSGK